MSWKWGLFWLFVSFGASCLLWSTAAKLVTRKNRRVGLPAPRYDERNSIATFKRMHQP